MIFSKSENHGGAGGGGGRGVALELGFVMQNLSDRARITVRVFHLAAG